MTYVQRNFATSAALRRMLCSGAASCCCVLRQPSLDRTLGNPQPDAMKDCVFCDIGAGRLKPDALGYGDDQVIAIYDRSPVTAFHTLVIPKRHSTDIFDVEEQDLIAVTSAIRRICRMYREKLEIDALQVVSSNGQAAQQDVRRLHFHIVPRKRDDGLDIAWKPNAAIRARFKEMLEPLAEEPAISKP
jgi:histidine triad (HIT) family protein